MQAKAASDAVGKEQARMGEYKFRITARKALVDFLVSLGVVMVLAAAAWFGDVGHVMQALKNAGFSDLMVLALLPVLRALCTGGSNWLKNWLVPWLYAQDSDPLNDGPHLGAGVLLLPLLLVGLAAGPATAEQAPDRLTWSAEVLTGPFLKDGGVEDTTGLWVRVSYQHDDRLDVGGRAAAGRAQDGGTVQLENPESYRDLAVTGYARYRLGRVLRLMGACTVYVHLVGGEVVDGQQWGCEVGPSIGDDRTGAHYGIGYHEPTGRGVRQYGAVRIHLWKETSFVAEGAGRFSLDPREIIRTAQATVALAVQTPWP